MKNKIFKFIIISTIFGLNLIIKAMELPESEINKTSELEVITDLHRAVLDNDIQKIIDLVGNGADVNAQDQEGNTPLHLAAKNNNKLAGQIIIASKIVKVKPGIRNNFGQLPADLAKPIVSKKKVEFERNISQDKPIHKAIKDKDYELVEALLMSGADLNELGKDNKTPIQLSLDLDNPEITELLLNHIDVKTTKSEKEEI